MEQFNSFCELPINWITCLLDDVIVKMSNGANVTQYDEKIGYPISRIETIWNENIDLERVKYITETDSDFIEKYALQFGDILLSHINSDSHLGKTGIFKKQVEVLIHGINLLLIRPSTHISSDFLNYQFKHLRAKGIFINAAQRAVNQSSINQQKLKSFQIIFPPLPEQHRIVAKIETLFSELDKGIECFKTAREQLKIYRQALLKHAFSGKLTEQWRSENQDKLETAEALLQRIQTEREQHHQQQLKDWEATGKQGNKPKSPKTLPPLTSEELAELPELPEGWVWVKLSAISTNIQIGPFGSLLHKEDYVSDAIPLVNPSHIKELKIIPDWNLTVNEQKLKELSNYILKANDIIIGRRGEMGRCAVIRTFEAGWLCGTGSLFVRLLPSLNADFYCHILSSKRVREYLTSSSIGTTMQNLNQEILHGVPVPLCSALEQEEIFGQIERQFSIADQFDQTLNTALEQAEALRQSILKKAFSGQLVPQDPNDEPASILLERIRAEKTALLSQVKIGTHKTKSAKKIKA